MDLILLFLSLLALAFAHARGPLAARQPTPNPLDFVDLRASGISPTADSASAARCAAALSGGALAFPNARVVRSPAGSVECRQRLVFRDVPVGYSLTVIAMEVSGLLALEKGSFVDKIAVGADYLLNSSGTPNSTAVLTDAATVSGPYGKNGTGYEGAFNLIMNLWPVDSSRTTRAKTACATRDLQPEMAVYLRVSLSHEQLGADPSVVHRGSVQDLRVGFFVMWERCGS